MLLLALLLAEDAHRLRHIVELVLESDQLGGIVVVESCLLGTNDAVCFLARFSCDESFIVKFL